ncbi:glycoside hydrolase family 3 N-terminal domain-containing protein [Paenibacillus sp. J22TS3]|uniref:glycoside hydrolase family 3 N-terminal domain-containing protein n=1 Tax=Paenibacillus sp. J22TS3 TaxID=2807192 RepID=UPI001B1EBF98|nr:glycoside hydrolase family 3 N-terminal domain-containing protein [Paenibacillus sp. J22TS3]GIP20702.1 hypothetical protein J22TS3_09770 [Paenibacillus sp. J22TS3]
MKKRKLSKWLSGLTAFSLILGLLPLPAVLGAPAAAANRLPAYLNPGESIPDRVADLLNRMSLDEKVGQMVQAERASVTPEDVKDYYLGSVLSGGGSFPEGKQTSSTQEKWTALYNSYQDGALSTPLGIPLLYGVDGLHGHNNVIGATLFPHNIGLGATRDPGLVKKIGAASAAEMQATGVNWTFAPTLAVVQNPRWGRTYEGFGDSPALSAELGAAYIQGLQGEKPGGLKDPGKVVATAKHFAGEGYTDNGTNQGNITAYTEEQIWNLEKEVYEAAVKAGVKTVMASYHSIQGIKMHANQRLLTDKLKGELGFKGFVISDYNAIDQINRDWDGKAVSGLKNQVRVAVNAGVDMIMEPDKWKEVIVDLKELVQEGAISEKRLDDAVLRILQVKFESGVFEHPKADPDLAGAFGSSSSRSVARESVQKSLVLLKNDKVADGRGGQSPILSQLPSMKKILVAGKSADDIGLQSGGWSITWQGSAGDITPGTTILKGIQDAAGSSRTVTYNKHGRGSAGQDVAIAVIGEKPYAETNGDAASLNLDAEDLNTLANIRSGNPDIPIVVVLVSGRPMTITNQMGDWAGLIAAWLPGTEGQGVADVLFGSKDFTGKLPMRWPFSLNAYPGGDASQFLFQTGYGLTRNQPTPTLPSPPEEPDHSQKIPGKIEAENFTAQSGIQTEDSQDTGGTRNISYIDAGDWLEYDVDAQSGTYKVDFRYSSWTDSTGLKIIDGTGKTRGTLSVSKTGSYQDWQTASIENISLPKDGKQKLKMQFTGGSMNLNWFSFTRTGEALPDNGGDPGGGGTDGVTPVVVEAGAVESWITNERNPGDNKWYYDSLYKDGDKKLEQQPNADIVQPNQAKGTEITIDPDQTYQSVVGIGSSMEESTIGNLWLMSEAKRKEVLMKLFSKTEGAGMSLVRLTIGTADFTGKPFYSYDDLPAGQTDPGLTHFSIQKDIDYHIIDTIKEIQKINPDVKFFASSWSPPGWMKTTDSMIKGQVKEEYLPVLADYFVKYIQAYKALGINIDALTMQNEPLLEIEYPSTHMPWDQQGRLAQLLRSKLDAAGFEDTKLWIFDHNPSDTSAYPVHILADEQMARAVDGTAFHDYGGDLSEMSRLHDLYPDKNVYLTERAVWGTQGADRIAQYFRNWARSYNSWVVMLDSDIKSHQWVGTPDPTPIIQDSADRNNYWLAPEYYLMGQFMKFVEPGYVRIDSNYGSSSTVTNVAFKSPDGKTIVTVVINQTADDQPVKLLSDGKQISAVVPAKSVATYRWHRSEQGKTAPGSYPAADFDEATGQFKADKNTGIVDHLNVDGDGNSAAGAAEFKYNLHVKQAGSYDLDLGYAGSLEDASLSAKVSDGAPVIIRENSKASEQPAGETAGASADGSVPAGDAAGAPAGGVAPAGDAAGAPADGSVPTGGTVPAKASVTEAVYGPGDFRYLRVRLDLPAGEQKLTLTAGGHNYALSDLRFTKADLDNTLPKKIQAENADQSSGILIQHQDANQLTSVTKSAPDAWLEYKVKVPADGQYQLTYRYASEGKSPTAVWTADGTDEPVLTTVLTGSEGPNDWKTVTDLIKLKEGSHTLRLSLEEADIHLDWFQIGPLVLTNPGAQAISLPGTAQAGDYISATGINAAEGPSGSKKLTSFDAGDWVDYPITVQKGGDYTVTVELATKNGGMNAFNLKAEDGTVLAKFDIPSTGDLNTWIKIRKTIALKSGEQKLRLSANTAGFEITKLAFEEKTAHTPGQNNMVKVEAENYFDADRNAIQTNSGYTNVGYLNRGSKLDYLVNIPASATGNYKVTYRYATPQSGVSVNLSIDGGSAGTLQLGSTGGWGNYTEASHLVAMKEGTKIVRLLDQGDGFNLDWFTIVPTDEVVKPEQIRTKIPAASLKAGSYDKPQTISLITGVEGARIYYTTDGTLPSAKNGTLYEGPFQVSGIVVIRAVAVKDGLADSFVAPYTYVTKTGGGTDGNNGGNNGGNPGGNTGGSNGGNQGGNTGGITGNTGGSASGTTDGKGVLKLSAPTLDPVTGIAVAVVTTEGLNQAIKDAGGSTSSKVTITAEVPSVHGQKGYGVQLPASYFTGKKMVKLELVTEYGSILIQDNMISPAEVSANSLIELRIMPADKTKLAASAVKAIGEHPALELALLIGGQPVAWNNPDAAVRVRFPYQPSAAEAASDEHITELYLDTQGRLNPVPNARYDAASGKVIFTTTQFGQYAVAYVTKTFGDIAKFSWAKHDIEVLASKGIVKGTSDTTFNPGDQVHRADFLVMLVNALGLSAKTEGNFADVNSSAYYYEAVGIAKQLGIAKGKENNRFDPLSPITRQEMMTLAARAMVLAGTTLPASSAAELNSFQDAEQVSGFAADSVAALVKSGIVNGDGHHLNPLSQTTRAETAVIIYRIYNK